MYLRTHFVSQVCPACIEKAERAASKAAVEADVGRACGLRLKAEFFRALASDGSHWAAHRSVVQHNHIVKLPSPDKCGAGIAALRAALSIDAASVAERSPDRRRIVGDSVVGPGGEPTAVGDIPSGSGTGSGCTSSPTSSPGLPSLPTEPLASSVGGNRLVHIAADLGDGSLERLLCLYPSLDVNVHNARFRTPLHIATYHGHVAEVRALLARGADATARDARGRTPAELARLVGSHVISALFEAAAVLDA